MYKMLEQNRLGSANIRSSRSSLRSRDSPRNRLKRMNTSQEVSFMSVQVMSDGKSSPFEYVACFFISKLSRFYNEVNRC